MLMIKNTKMLTGITVHGDYQDLNSLYDSLHKYLAFYFQNQENYDNDFYESLLGLCYDIRHAYQGDRNIESVENNAENIGMLASCIYQMDEEALTEDRSKYASGNLYFSVEILYPLALFYHYSLQYILDDWYDAEWFCSLDFPYDRLTMQRDRSVIQMFLDIFWFHLKNTLPDNTAINLYDYFENNTEVYPCHPLYVECLCQFYVSQTKSLPEDNKKVYLLGLAYELASSELLTQYPDQFAQASADYQSALDVIKEGTQLPLYSYIDFYNLYTDFFNDSTKKVTEESQEDFIQKYFGSVDWEHLIW